MEPTGERNKKAPLPARVPSKVITVTFSSFYPHKRKSSAKQMQILTSLPRNPRHQKVCVLYGFPPNRATFPPFSLTHRSLPPVPITASGPPGVPKGLQPRHQEVGRQQVALPGQAEVEAPDLKELLNRRISAEFAAVFG